MYKIYPSILAIAILFTLSCSSEPSKTENPKAVESKNTETINKTETSNNQSESMEGSSENSETSVKNSSLDGTEPEPITPIEIWPDDKIDSENNVIISEQLVDVVDNYDFHKYEKLNSFLKKYVSASGKVNYNGIKSNKSSLEAILKEFESNYINSSWSKNQKLTYWINAYNIYTIKLIVDNYPTSSITKIAAEPWKKKFIKLGGSTISLNHIENEIIRKQFNEPRIHFALNCASKSCPVLLNAAYMPNNLNSKLTSQTKRFLNDTSKNNLDNSKKIYISKIFDWYGADFKKNGSTIVSFINKYRTEQLESPKIDYTEYSWDLNN